MRYVACWAQPPENFQSWKADGVNVAIGPDLGNPPRFTQAQVHQLALEAGLKVIDVPSDEANLERMIADPNVIAIGLPDELDLHLVAYNVDPAGFQAGVAALIAKHSWIVTKTAGRKRHYINFAGPKVLGGTKEPVRPYAGQMQQPFVDLLNSVPRKAGVEPHILSADFYSLNANAGRYPVTFPAETLAVMKKWWGSGFTYWAYLECSDQVLDGTEDPANPKNIGRGPTADEMEAEYKALLDAGVEGISWFSHKFNIGWKPNDQIDGWDGRNAEQRLKCRDIAARFNPAPIPPFDSEAAFKKLENSFGALAQQFDVQKNLTLQIENQLNQLKANAIISIDVKRS